MCTHVGHGHSGCSLSRDFLSGFSFPHGAWLRKRHDHAATERAQQGPGDHGRGLGPQHGRAPGRRSAPTAPRSPGSQPPSGPTATTGRSSPGRPPRRGEGRRGAGHTGDLVQAAHRGDLGQPGPSALGRRLAGHPAEPVDRLSPRSPSQRTTERAVRRGTIRSTPSSVSFWTTHSGRSPLVGANATVTSGAGRGTHDRGPVGHQHAAAGRPGGTPGGGVGRHPARDPATGAVGGHHRSRPARRRSTSRRWRRSAGSTTGADGSATKTMAAAATSTGSGAGGGGAAPRSGPGPRSAERGAQLGEEALGLGASPSASARGPRPARPAAPAGRRRGRSACPPGRGRRGRPGPGPAAWAHRGPSG